MPASHPLLATLLNAADNIFPPVDGGVTIVPPFDNGWGCCVAFTGHAVIATARPREEILARGADGFGGANSPEVLRYLAGPTGLVGVTDVMLVARGTGRSALPRRTDADDHPRVQYARDQRTNVEVFGDERGIVTLSNGLAGRREFSIETAEHNRGWGRELIGEALGLVPEGEPVFAAVSPGNARSLRMFLSLGFVPIGSECMIRPG
jgi:hypothetical protein